MPVQSDQSANEALLVPAKPTRTSREKYILYFWDHSPEIINVSSLSAALEGSTQRVKHEWRATQHFFDKSKNETPTGFLYSPTTYRS